MVDFYNYLYLFSFQDLESPLKYTTWKGSILCFIQDDDEKRKCTWRKGRCQGRSVLNHLQLKRRFNILSRKRKRWCNDDKATRESLHWLSCTQQNPPTKNETFYLLVVLHTIKYVWEPTTEKTLVAPKN